MTAASNSEARKRASEAASAKVAADAHPRFWAQFIAEHFPSAKRDAPLVTCDCGWAEAFDETGADWPDHVARELARALAEDVAASNSESPLSQPIPAPVDSGAIGRLNERQTVDALLACLPMHEDGTGHVVDCGFDWEVTAPCGCASLPGRLAAIVRERTERALAEVEERLRSAKPFHATRNYTPVDEAYDTAIHIVRAARQEQGR